LKKEPQRKSRVTKDWFLDQISNDQYACRIRCCAPRRIFSW
jgi:hypothetical protein